MDLKLITEKPFEYLYLRRKRKFEMEPSGVKYGDGSQCEFTVVFSPDKLVQQYPIHDIEVRHQSGMVPVFSDYKSVYYSLSDESVQKHISEETASDITKILLNFVEFGDWYGSEQS